jgi:hypothetical protein
MKRWFATLAVLCGLFAAMPGIADEGPPVKVSFYYKVKWGAQAEFESLYFRNYHPVLLAQVGEGKRMKGVEVYKPTYHGDGRADWTFLVVVTYLNADASLESSHDQTIIARLYPDQQKYKHEEARRFELLDAHWDIPLTAVTPPSQR